VDFPFTLGIALPGEAPQDHRQVARRSVSRRYFEVLGLPLVRGRMFASDAKGEIVVNEAFVRTWLDGGDGVGQTVRQIDDKGAVVGPLTIVGVVRDAYLSGLERIDPIVFRPTTSGVLITSGGAATVERIRALAHGVNHAASVRAWPLSQDIGGLLNDSRFGAAVAGGIGLLGLLLACVGVLGVFAYAVEERRREIGVRIALGAARAQIVGTLIATSGRGMLLGLGAGLLLSLACGPVLRSYLFGLNPLDPSAYGGVLLLLAATGTLATLVPARRACRVDPAITLRED
jgi:ABC-type antimicrobial peptide transport system permease subunit